MCRALQPKRWRSNAAGAVPHVHAGSVPRDRVWPSVAAQQPRVNRGTDRLVHRVGFATRGCKPTYPLLRLSSEKIAQAASKRASRHHPPGDAPYNLRSADRPCCEPCFTAGSTSETDKPLKLRVFCSFCLCSSRSVSALVLASTTTHDGSSAMARRASSVSMQANGFAASSPTSAHRGRRAPIVWSGAEAV